MDYTGHRSTSKPQDNSNIGISQRNLGLNHKWIIQTKLRTNNETRRKWGTNRGCQRYKTKSRDELQWGRAIIGHRERKYVADGRKPKSQRGQPLFSQKGAKGETMYCVIHTKGQVNNIYRCHIKSNQMGQTTHTRVLAHLRQLSCQLWFG